MPITNVAATKGKSVHNFRNSTNNENSGRNLVQKVDLASTTSDNVRSIATAVEQQSAPSEEIAKAINEINDTTDVTARAMEESSEAITELAQLAGKLRTTIMLCKD